MTQPQPAVLCTYVVYFFPLPSCLSLTVFVLAIVVLVVVVGFFAESVVSVMGFKIEQILITKRIVNANVGRCKMFPSLFSDRYNNKREVFYRRYESEFVVE